MSYCDVIDETCPPEAADGAAALMWRGDLRRTMAARSGRRLAGWAARDDRAKGQRALPPASIAAVQALESDELHVAA